MNQTRKLRWPALAALATSLLGLMGPQQAAAQNARNEFGLHWTPGTLASDDRRSRGLAYDRDFGNGWSLGGTLGYGRVEALQEGDGAYGVLRLRKRFAGLPSMPNVSPQVGLEYGGTTDIWNTSEIVGGFVGVHFAASPELGFTLDGWFGKLRFESGSLVGPTEQTRRDSVQNIRLGLVFRY
jgi:hypothetical protein